MNQFHFIRSAPNGCLRWLFILGFLTTSSPTLLANPSSHQAGVVITEDELSVSYKNIVNSDQLLKLRNSSGQQLVESIGKIIKEERPLVEKEHLLLLSVTIIRQQGLAQKKLPVSYQQLLKSLAKMQTKILTTYSDGHDQMVYAYPYAQSAKSTLDFFDDLSLTQTFLTLIIDGEYQQLITQLPEKKSRQVNLLRPAINQLNKSQSEQLLFWAKSNQTLAPESILQLAIQSAQSSTLIDTLLFDPQLPLHHYFSAFDKQWDANQQFEILKQSAAIKAYASVSLYQLDKLEINEQIKHDYLIKTLSSKTAGSTSAAILAKQMSPALVDELAYMVQSQPFNSTQQNAFLAMLLSRNLYALERARQMYERQLISERLAGEVSAWFE